MERIVKARMQWYLETEHILAPEQAGFRQVLSTEEHIISYSIAIILRSLTWPPGTSLTQKLERALESLKKTTGFLEKFGLMM